MEGHGVRAKRRLVSCVLCMCVYVCVLFCFVLCSACMHHALKAAESCMSKEVKYSFVCASVAYVVFNGRVYFDVSMTVFSVCKYPQTIES